MERPKCGQFSHRWWWVCFRKGISNGPIQMDTACSNTFEAVRGGVTQTDRDVQSRLCASISVSDLGRECSVPDSPHIRKSVLLVLPGPKIQRHIEAIPHPHTPFALVLALAHSLLMPFPFTGATAATHLISPPTASHIHPSPTTASPPHVPTERMPLL
jgi:hypothetical protein